MHLSTDQIALLAHGERTTAETDAARAHTRTCGLCANLVAEARALDEITGARLRSLKTTPPPITADIIIRHARRRHARARAAAVVAFLFAGAAVAVALPRTPLAALLARIVGSAQPAHRPAPAPVTRQHTRPAASAVALAPHDSLFILFPHDFNGTLRVSLAPGSTASASSSDPAATYTIEQNSITVHAGAKAATYELRVPAQLSHVRVNVGNLVVARKDGPEFRCLAHAVTDVCVVTRTHP
jgi:hypothetical protein